VPYQVYMMMMIKCLLSNEPILKLPDINQEFILQTDVSNQSLGGCLLQMHEGVDDDDDDDEVH